MTPAKAAQILATMDRRPLSKREGTALDKALLALNSIIYLHTYIEPDDPHGGPSSADTCDALYQTMHRLGLEVV